MGESLRIAPGSTASLADSTALIVLTFSLLSFVIDTLVMAFAGGNMDVYVVTVYRTVFLQLIIFFCFR